MGNKQNNTQVLLFFFMVLENLCLYYFFKQGILTSGKNAILLFLSSMMFGIVFLYRFYNAEVSVGAVTPSRKKLAYVLVPLFLLGLVLLGIAQSGFFATHPMENAGSDVVLSVRMLSRRFLGGVNPYEFVNGRNAPYYPFHWLPFIFAPALHVDYRMMPYFVWCIAALWLAVRATKAQNTALQVLLPITILGSYYAMFSANTTIIEATVEIMVAGYYMMLMVSISTGRAVLQGIIFSFCLLSRYSLVLWMPLYVFTLFVSGNRKQLLITAGISAGIVLCIFVPFIINHPELLTAYKEYDEPALWEWDHLNDVGKPMHLWAGTGFAYYIYTRFAELDLLSRIKILQKMHLICCCGITIILGVWYWFKKGNINHRLFLLGSFKLYITVFLFLIQVPYVYLTSVGNFITIALICEQARYRIKYRSVKPA